MPTLLAGVLIIISFALVVPSNSLAQAICSKELQRNSVDYRSRTPEAVSHMRKVEGAHFTRSVQMGIAGNTGSLMGDLDYTLRHIPNHHRALMVLIDHQMSDDFSFQRSLRRDRQWEPVKCYLQRARLKAPDDPAVMVIHGIYNHRLENYEEAERAYKQALEASQLPRQKVEIYYNLGLLYVDVGDYPSAKRYADKAYDMDYPLQGLKNRLARMKQN